ncbi:DUF6851 domain-containing protein, partial [Roseibium sp. RKSG952]|uniref:DUF6851 domain-containing protein n=1 Tax=Roseibium sp. RKSG952 TaxID=2529384 RepID=UPI0034CDB5FE
GPGGGNGGPGFPGDDIPGDDVDDDITDPVDDVVDDVTDPVDDGDDGDDVTDPVDDGDDGNDDTTDDQGLIVDEDTEAVTTGDGDDNIEIAAEVGTVDLGAGNDQLTVSDYVDAAYGGDGEDVLTVNMSTGDVDIVDNDGVVTIIDRFSGEEMVTEGFETIEFTDATYSADELADLFGADAAEPIMQVAEGSSYLTVNDDDPSISVIWDRVIQQAVIETDTVVGPTIASRAYAMMHTAMYDAWSSFDETAVRVSFDQEGDNFKVTGADDEAKAKAMSYAAITVLQELFPDMEDLYVEVMEERLGFSMEDDGSVEAEIGIDAAEDLLALRAEDGSNQEGDYADTTGYTPVNPNPDEINDITKWTPENVPIDPEDPEVEQSFLTPQWEEVESFALPETADGETDFSQTLPPQPQDFFTEEYAGSVLNFDAQTITLDNAITIDGVTYEAGEDIPVSQDLIGSVINAGFIEQAEDIVDISANLTDEEKV